ncbi:MAG TPA: aspartyl protease family protein [Thermoanaerobaculia bacterium]|nr:aspartyl protease family protein [Thermoanaerobaculia bacterium]
MSRKVVLAAALLLAGCTLYNEVSFSPLTILPTNIDRGSDLQSMLRKADFLRAIEMAPLIDARPKSTAADYAALGSAFLAAGRFDEARTRLRAGLDLKPFRTTYSQIAWDLAQVEYLSNNFEQSLEWAKIAADHGLNVRKWHMDYLAALSNVAVYSFPGETSARVPFRFGKPEVPRITTRLNGMKDVDAIIDSGAVLSIISKGLATQLSVKSLGTFEGTFYGLLGEPIPVRFALLDRLEIGSIVIENVPVAIMPDEKMKFLISKRERIEFRMEFLLGTNLLKEFRLELDFKSYRATFARLTAADRRPDANQNLFFHGFRPHVRGAVNRHAWYLFVLDTGSEITFLNQSRLSALPMQIFASGTHSATLQGLGGAMKRGAKLEDVEIGIGAWGGRFRTLPMYTSEEREIAVGIVGQNFLKNFHVVIDFGRMRVDLER